MKKGNFLIYIDRDNDGNGILKEAERNHLAGVEM
ncbi:hypothetical protein CNEO3_590002 [Clostridium neonatale]|nr:hypothetical protein CNEO_1200002 [Clostridium neonatale]CAI3633562.1 hypothetical protein CNEO3_620002 [Clostridium neonatale]CAI3675861.1 hypothetical protein CNEO3_560002 [Clostridium neonatale]CAI3694595.1 hypothetical protein CNEO3_580002 [Clostridium neonatale]CAI3696398.1 hypothetical protein CNEO3_610002 [Clostridium neonatale]